MGQVDRVELNATAESALRWQEAADFLVSNYIKAEEALGVLRRQGWDADVEGAPREEGSKVTLRESQYVGTNGWGRRITLEVGKAESPISVIPVKAKIDWINSADELISTGVELDRLDSIEVRDWVLSLGSVTVKKIERPNRGIHDQHFDRTVLLNLNSFPNIDLRLFEHAPFRNR